MSTLHLFVDADKHARRLKTLRGLTPTEFILDAWTKEPDRFEIDPSHPIPGPYKTRLSAFHPVMLALTTMTRVQTSPASSHVPGTSTRA